MPPQHSSDVSVSDRGRSFHADQDLYSVEIGTYNAHYGPAPRGTTSTEHSGPDSVRVPLAATLRSPVRDRDPLRQALLPAITSAAASERLHVVYGMPGCGKTAIAQTLFDEAVREHGVVGLWVNAATESSFRSGMLAVAQDRGATQDEVDAARDGRRPAADLVWHRLDQSAQRWLLVLDNADDPAALGDGVWLRPSNRGTILITTRHGNAPIWKQAQPHPLDVLELPDAVNVLLDLDVPADSQAQLEQLAQALGCHPLALVLAGTYLGRRLLDPVTVDEFLERLRRDPSTTLDEGADPAERDLRRLISSTWQISLDALTDRGVPEATTLIRLLSCFSSDPLPIGLLHASRLNATGLAQADPSLTGARADSALEGLRSQSMVATLDAPGDIGRPDVKCVQTHALLLDTVAACIPMDQRETILTAAVILLEDLLSKEADESTYLDAQSLRLFTPHALALLDRTTRARSAASARSLAVVRYLRAQSYDRGDYTTAHTLAAAAAASHDMLPTPDMLAALADRHELARTIAALGRYGEAADQLREVLAAREEQLGLMHRHTLDSAQALALSLYGLGAWAEDETYARRAFEGRARMLGADHPDTIMSAACLAEAVGEQQRWDEAEDIARPNLGRSVNSLGRDHPNTLAACHTLAWVLFKKGQVEEARSLIEGTLTARLRLLGATHPRTLAARSMLANILRAQEQWEAAKDEALTVLSLRERTLGTEHPHTLGLRTVLIHIQIGAGETDAALDLAESNLAACVRVHGQDHPETVSCQQALQQARTAKEAQR